MITMTASEIRKWGETTRQAQRDIIEVQSHGVPAVYIVGVEEFRNLQAIKKAALEEKLLKATQGRDEGEISTATPTDIAKQAKVKFGL